MKFAPVVSIFSATLALTCGLAWSEPAPSPAAKDHWAFKKPIEPAIPAVKETAWVRSPIDAFVAAKLEEKGLKHASPADRRTLIRRAYFDLIGLPPTAEAVDAFVADRSPDAFAKVVDQLLADPRYGERWGRYWLDVARYADTKGYVFQEERRYPYAYTYRDYVIRSFNEDKPYDRFLIEQIAADRLNLGEDKRPLAAMGFLTLGRRFLNRIPDVVDDRMDVVCRGTMAVTIGCARCHNHKFDPIPTKDYYSLYSIFVNSPDAKSPPLIGEPEMTPEYETFLKEQKKHQATIDQYLADKFAELVPPLRSASRIAEYLINTRLEKIDEKAYASGIGVNGFVLGRWKARLNHGAEKNDPVFVAWRAYSRIPESEFATKTAAVTEELGKTDPGRTINPLVRQAFAGEPPKSLQDVADRYGKLLSQYDKPDKLANADEEELRQVVRGDEAPPNVSMADLRHLFKRDSRDHLNELQRKLDAFTATNPAAPPRAMALEEATTMHSQHVFVRGNEGNLGEEVKPHFLTCLSTEAKPFTQGSGRLEFAEAVASKENPLTARVMVNRVWLHHFGFGIVRTPSDFGTRSDAPTHPELLDYLALRFMEDGWSIKSLHRRMMLSSTYQMSADASPEDDLQDGQNLLLSHFNRQRLDFESTRDALLFVGGKLDPRMFGRSVDLTTDAGSTRRTIYSFIDRQNLPGLFRSFDFASPDATCPRRFNTTVPQQALFMMNSPFFIDQSKAVVRRSEISAVTDPSEKISRLYRLLFNRAPDGDELAMGVAFVAGEQQQAHEMVVWQYGFGEFDEASHHVKTFTPFPHFSGSAWQGGAKMPDTKLVFASLTAGGGHPGLDQRHAVIRRWISPIDGAVKISGTLEHPESHGDGVRGRIVSSQAGELASWNVLHGQAETSLDNVAVKKGDAIDFMVDCRGNDTYDSFGWSPTVRVADVPTVAGNDAPQQWNAATNFGGADKTAATLSEWEKYVQVLLESNEFVFVD